MSFTKFPRFQRISQNDYPTYLRYFSLLREPCSDLSLDNALVWLDFNGSLEVSDLYGNLVVRFNNVFDHGSTYYSLVGDSYLKDTLTELFSYLHTQTRHPKLAYVPEQVANQIIKLNDSNIRLDEDTDNRDYIYSVRDLVRMEGAEYKNLRGRVNAFLQNNPYTYTNDFNLQDKTEREKIKDTIYRWSQKTRFTKNDPEKWELTAINKHIDLSPHLSTQAFGIYSGQSLECIVAYHTPPQEKWLIANHIKYNYEQKGIFGYATYQLALKAQQAGIDWINFEQDLGKEGIRNSKMLLRPEKFIHRYTVSFAPDFRNQ